MNKEEALDLLKHLILQLRDHSKELQSDPRLMQDWAAKNNHLQSLLKSLNSCDTLWINDSYAIFHKQEIQPYVSKLDPKMYKKLV
jgi:hypothetical protein